MGNCRRQVSLLLDPLEHFPGTPHLYRLPGQSFVATRLIAPIRSAPCLEHGRPCPTPIMARDLLTRVEAPAKVFKEDTCFERSCRSPPSQLSSAHRCMR